MHLAITINSDTRDQIHEDACGDVELFALVDDVEHCLSRGLSTVGVAEGAEEAVAFHVSVYIVDNQGACGVAGNGGVREVAAELIDRAAVSVGVNYGPGEAGELSCICYECSGFADEVVLVCGVLRNFDSAVVCESGSAEAENDCKDNQNCKCFFHFNFPPKFF